MKIGPGEVRFSKGHWGSAQVGDADLRTQWDTASLPGSAGLVLGIISSVEDAMRFRPVTLIPLRCWENVFSSSVTCWHAQSKYPRCSRRSWGWMLILLPGMCFGEEVGFLVVVGIGCGQELESCC